MFTDSVGQDFGKGTVGMAFLCFMKDSKVLGECTAGARENLVGSSSTHLALDAGCRWGLQLELLAETSTHSFSPWPEFSKTWQPQVFRAPKQNVLRILVETTFSFIT